MDAHQKDWSVGFGAQLDRIGRYWMLFAAIALASTLAGLVAAVLAKPEYVGQAVLSAASSTRSPDQDANLAQGYVFVFDDPAYQKGLSERAKVSGDVSSYTARTAGVGPVFYITATSSSADSARAAATAMAQEFVNEINSTIGASRDQTIATMTEKMQEVWGPGLANNDEAAVIARDNLQEHVNSLNADQANQVTLLRADAGVTEIEAGRIQTLGLAVVCGILLGCVAAVVAGIASKRIVTDYDVAEKLDLELLDVLPSTADTVHAGTRAVRLQRLVNVLARPQSDRPAAIAVGPAAGGESGGAIAESIATLRAANGTPTVLIHADLHRQGQWVSDGRPGLAELLAPDSSTDVGDVLQPVSQHLSVIGPGHLKGDACGLFDHERFARIIDALRERASFIVISAPALAHAGEAQVISDVADGTLLIIEQGDRVDDVREAIRALDQVAAHLIGTVLAETTQAGFHFRPNAHVGNDTQSQISDSDETRPMAVTLGQGDHR